MPDSPEGKATQELEERVSDYGDDFPLGEADPRDAIGTDYAY